MVKSIPIFKSLLKCVFNVFNVFRTPKTIENNTPHVYMHCIYYFPKQIKDGVHFSKWPPWQTITQIIFNQYTIVNNIQLSDSLVNEWHTQVFWASVLWGAPLPPAPTRSPWPTLLTKLSFAILTSTHLITSFGCLDFC